MTESDLRAVLKLLQASCLAPYNIAKDRQSSKRSIILIFYNLSFAAFVMYNLVYAENDIRNDVDYENKSFLIRLAFDVVDVLENIQPCFLSLKALIFTKAGIDIWFKISSINQKLKTINVEYDHRKLKNYLFAKVCCFLVMSTIFLSTDIILCGKLRLFYTVNYWILCAIPLFQSSITVAGFSGLVLILYQRFWALNEIITRAINYDKEAWVDVSWQQMDYEKLSASYLCRFYLNQSINLKKSQSRAREKTPRKPPYLVMLKNYDCFGGNFYNERNLPRLIRFMKILHFDLVQVSEDVNSIFGWNLLFVFTTGFFGVTINLYFVIIYHLNTYEIEEYISCLIWMFIYLFKILYVIIYSTKASKEAQRTIGLLHTLLSKLDFNDRQLQAELTSFCLQVTQCKVEFKAAEFFIIDRSIFFQFVAGVLTNVVFVVQFDNVNFSI